MKCLGLLPLGIIWPILRFPNIDPVLKAAFIERHTKYDKSGQKHLKNSTVKQAWVIYLYSYF